MLIDWRLFENIFFQIFGSSKTGEMSTEVPRKTITDFGYGFNEAGIIKKLKEDGKPGEEGFEFNISSDHAVNQKHYDALGEVSVVFVI